jgi:hypothetical protein
LIQNEKKKQLSELEEGNNPCNKKASPKRS